MSLILDVHDLCYDLPDHGRRLVDGHAFTVGAGETLVLLGRDYDGGTKAWVRWPDGSDDIVPGSRVERRP